MPQLSIPARFNGPPSSGNGGYSCGAVAAFIDGVARVRLHSPPPLDKPLPVYVATDGSVEVFDGELLVASGFPASLQLDVPPAPSLEQARRGRENFPVLDDHLYGTCFVCGNNRPHADGLALYPGPVDDWSLLACTWQPAPDLADDAGMVLPEIVWSALDCPGCYAAMGDAMQPVLLGELRASLLAPVPAAEELIVYAWSLGREGRKLYGGVAIANQSGVVLACSHTTWITLKS